jgi:hypothetical protein
MRGNSFHLINGFRMGWALGLLLIAITGCGSTGQQDSTKAEGGTTVVETSVPIEVRIQRASQAQLFCMGESCNPRTVMLSMVTSKGVTRCSGVLIGQDRVLTNDHCVKAVLAESSCQGNLFAHFAPSVSDPARTVGCQEIETRSFETGADSPDYAVIRLANAVTGRGDLSFSTRGIKQKEWVRIERVTPLTSSTGSLDGMIAPIQCQATYASMLFPAVRSDRFPLMTFGNCPIEHGNSGGPIFNSDGDLAGVIQGYFDSRLLPSGKKLAVGSQAICMNGVHGNAGTSKQCDPVVRAQGLFPDDYKSRYANPGLMPDFISEGTVTSDQSERWVKLRNPQIRWVQYVKLPTCYSAEAEKTLKMRSPITLSVRTFIAEIGPTFEVEYREYRTGVFTEENFQVQKNQQGVQFTRVGFGSVQIPYCTAR